MDRKGFHPTKQKLTIPWTTHVVLSTRHPPSPEALRNPCLADVVHRAEVGFESPPKVGDRRRLEGMRPRCFRTGSLQPGWDSFARATSISPRTAVKAPPPPLILHPIAPQWYEQTEMVLIKKKINTIIKTPHNRNTAEALTPSVNPRRHEGYIPCFLIDSEPVGKSP